MSVSCRAHGCIFLSFLLKRQKITTVGSEQPENITFHGKRQKKSAMGRSVPKRWAQVDFTAHGELEMTRKSQVELGSHIANELVSVKRPHGQHKKVEETENTSSLQNHRSDPSCILPKILEPNST